MHAIGNTWACMQLTGNNAYILLWLFFPSKHLKHTFMKTTFGNRKTVHRVIVLYFFFHFQAWFLTSHILFAFCRNDMSLGNVTLGYVGMSCYSTLENMMCWHNHAWPLSKRHVKSWQFSQRHIWFSVHIFGIYYNLIMRNVKDRENNTKEVVQSWSQILRSAFIQIRILVSPCTARAEYSVSDWFFMQTNIKQIQIIIFEH